MSEKLATRALYETAEVRAAPSCSAFPPQTMAFWRKMLFSSCSLPPERYNRSDSGSKKEIPE
jgi:hypothetical protein